MRLARAGYFDWRLFLPFALGSIPLATVGGAWSLTDSGYKIIVGAAFILVNSIAGLAGYTLSGQPWPGGLPWLVLAALFGGVIGSELAVRRLAPVHLKKLLGVVLAIAGAKMIALV